MMSLTYAVAPPVEGRRMERGCHKVLIAVDGSEHTQRLIDYLSGIISAQHTEIVLFHVMPKAPESFADREKEPFSLPNADHLRKWEAERETQVRDLMRDIRRQLTAHRHTRVFHHDQHPESERGHCKRPVAGGPARV